MIDCALKEYFMRHGIFSWNELMASDPEKAKKFYGELFGWTFEEMPIAEGPMAGKIYVVAKSGDAMAAGILPKPDGCEAPDYWGPYVTVDNIEEALKKVKELGGEVTVPATMIPGVGSFSVIQDNAGAYLMLMEYSFK